MSAVEPRRIINTHDQLVAAGGGVAIMPGSAMGRGPQSQCCWRVYRINAAGQPIVTDHKAAWYDHKLKTFNFIGRSEKPVALEKAKAWVAENLGYNGPWSGNRMRDYVPTEINKRFPIPKNQP